MHQNTDSKFAYFWKKTVSSAFDGFVHRPPTRGFAPASPGTRPQDPIIARPLWMTFRRPWTSVTHSWDDGDTLNARALVDLQQQQHTAHNDSYIHCCCCSQAASHYYVDATYCYTRSTVVCLSVGLSVTIVSHDGCMIASDTLFDSRGGFPGSSYPIKI